MKQDPRPIELTLLAWLAILVAGFRLLIWIFVAAIPESHGLLRSFDQAQSELAILHMTYSAHFAIGVIGALTWLAAGIGMLRGRPWSRVVILAWGVFALTLGYLTTGSLHYLGYKVVGFGLLLAVLLTPRVNQYFSRHRVGTEPMSR